MKKVNIFSSKPKDLIVDFATALETTCVQGCDDYLLKIPKKYGRGSIRALGLQKDLSILILDCNFNQDVQTVFHPEKSDLLKFSYCLKGNLRHTFADEDEVYEVQEYQSSIIFDTVEKTHNTIFQKNKDFTLFTVVINKTEFHSRFQCYIEKATPEIQDIFLPGSKEAFYYRGAFTIEIKNLFQKIEQDSLKPFTKRLYMEAFVNHLIVIQLLQYEDDQ